MFVFTFPCEKQHKFNIRALKKMQKAQHILFKEEVTVFTPKYTYKKKSCKSP